MDPPTDPMLPNVHLGEQPSHEGLSTSQRVVKGSKEVLESQFRDIIITTVDVRSCDMVLSGDPCMNNRVRAFILLRYYRGGGWDGRIEVSVLST